MMQNKKPPQLTRCPTKAQIGEFLLGKLSENQADSIASHLETCTSCEKTAEELDAGTNSRVFSQLGRIVGKRIAEMPADEPSSLQAALFRARNVAGLETTPTGAADTNCDPDGANQVQLILDRLAPPQADGELGRVGGFRILDVLGVGGMGVVFRAEDMRLQRAVAMKVVKPSIAASPSAKVRFLREARLSAAIVHEHVIAIHQVAEEGGVPFLTMPLLEGQSLRGRLDSNKQLSFGEILRIARETAEGLNAAHQQGLLHRDVKPDNIWLEGERSHVRILDFGLARLVESDAELTEFNQILGTPEYMAPEQALGQPLDYRADLFSLGCVMYRMAAGKSPFSGLSSTATLIAVVHDTPLPIGQHNDRLPDSFCQLVHRLLAKNPDDRFLAADDVIAAIRVIENDSTSEATSNPQIQRSQVAVKKRRSWKQRLMAFGILSVLVAMGIVIAIETDKGTLRITADPELFAMYIRGKEVRIRDRETGKDVTITIADTNRIASGRYAMAVLADSGLKFDTEEFEIIRGQETKLRAEFIRPSPTRLVNSITSDRATAAWLEESGCQVEIVRQGSSDRITSLQLLNLFIDTDQIDRLSALSELRSLIITGGAEICDLRFLANMPKLTMLNAKGSHELSSTEWLDVKHARSLRYLYADQTEFNDECLSQLTRLGQVTEITIDETRITNVGLAHLARIPTLRFISLEKNAISDAGLEHLKKLTNLKRLNLRETQVSAQGVASLAQAIPNCSIQNDF